jgi:hypothetical protein
MKRKLIPLALSAAASLTLATAAAGAEALFVASKGGTIKITNVGLRTFTLADGKEVSCEEATGSGYLPGTTLTASSVGVSLFISHCEAFGDAVTVTTGDVVFSADGAVGLFTVKFIATVPVAKCSLEFGIGGHNGSLGTIKYTNSGDKVDGEAIIGGMEYEAHSANSSSLCGTPKLAAEGTAQGRYVVELENGTLKVEG